ncbi:putative chromosome-partitioning protein ParB [Methylogaea oryzae]|uniref:Probable chromosome-partitioning protein ParB n=1 Tax=Methylogaea oryzae TaxID=1295382 RepID=A0A8D4VT94_9GAMM|nr:putative chromosome-partitioning protein ParB [Methylogaea oryzae]
MGGLEENEEGAVAAAADSFHTLAIEQLQPGRFQPRKDMDPVRLQELADSIKAQGVVQPVVVRPVDGGRYEIIAGERRWRAAQLAGMHDVPVVVRKINDQAALAMALIENIQREDLNPLEEAEALQRLIAEFGLTHQQTAEAVGKSRTAVTNLLRLNELQPRLKSLLGTGAIDMGHARALLGLHGELQVTAAEQVVARELTVRATEELVRKLQKEDREVRKKPAADPDVRHLQNRLSETLGAPVSIQHGQGGKGKLVISYQSLDALEGIIARLG